MDISRWRKPPGRHTICSEPRRGDGMLVARFPQPLAGAWPIFMTRTGGLRHRLISNVPPGQFESFPALTLQIRPVLVGLKTNQTQSSLASHPEAGIVLFASSRDVVK